MIKKVNLVLAILTAALTTSSWGVTPRSTSYTFEYVAVGLGGGISSSASYQLTAYADESGSAGKADSTNYSIEPVVGAPSETVRTEVNSWALYD
jgi:hypothetical protein